MKLLLDKNNSLFLQSQNAHALYRVKTRVRFGIVKTVNCFCSRATSLCFYEFIRLTRIFFSGARARLWKYSQFTHSPSIFLLCRCNIEDIFHGWGAHRIRYQASMSFHGDGGYTQLYKKISLRNNLWFNFHLLIIQENQR